MSERKQVVLVQPKHGVWDQLFVRLPESVLSVAALPHSQGYDVTILDQRVQPDWQERLVAAVADKPICVGVTSLTGPSLDFALQAMALIRQTDPTIPIVFGGVHATLLPEQCMEHPDIDILVKGEGDFSFFEVIRALEEQRPLDSIKGIFYRRDDQVVFTGEPQRVMDLDALPDTPYDLVDMSKYSAAEITNEKSVSLPTARGCPASCRFCGNKVLHHNKYRTISVENLIRRVTFLRDTYGYRTFVFLDDCLSVSLVHFRQLIQALKALEPRITWSTTGIRADIIAKLTDDDVDFLWDSGCRALDLGAESGSERILQYINKGETKDEIRRANQKLARHPIRIKYTFIVGFPTETDEEIDETLEFYEELSMANPHVYPMFFVYCPIAGTSLFDEIVRNGFSPPRRIQEWGHIDSRQWYHYVESWIPKRNRRRLETIMISAIFCNRNAKLKFTTPFSRLAFSLYHPFAKLRFRHRFFGLPLESYLTDLLR